MATRGIPTACQTYHIYEKLAGGDRNVKKTLDKLPEDKSCLRPAAADRAKGKSKYNEFGFGPIKQGRPLVKGDNMY